MYHIIKAIYEQYKENKRAAVVWIDPQTYEIKIDGGNLTVVELYKEVQDQQDQLRETTSVNDYIKVEK
jgi:hypothetical protein